MEVIRKLQLLEKAKDVKEWGISEGTILYVIKEGPVAPFGNHQRLLLVRVDNGTGDLELMPETVVRDKDIKFKILK